MMAAMETAMPEGALLVATNSGPGALLESRASAEFIARGDAARVAAFQRMEEAFPSNRGLRPSFLMMANAHRVAIDYITQAPVIVGAVTRGTMHVGMSEYALFQEQFARLCESGVRLREMMRFYGLPLPLRKLEAQVLKVSRATAIHRLSLMNPSTLSQIIPDTRKKQNAWLQALEQWCWSMARNTEGRNDRCPLFEWAAINFSGISFREADSASHMADFVQSHVATFNPRWTLHQVRQKEQAWHEELALDEPDAEDIGRPNFVIDYDFLPKLWEKDGYRFSALQTRKALRQEGAAMHHCVASYWHNVAIGRSRIYSVSKNGARIATLELSNQTATYRWQTGLFKIRQMVGARNSRPQPEVSKVAEAFIGEINEIAPSAT